MADRSEGIQGIVENLIGRKVDIVEDGTLRPWAIESVNKDKYLIYERAK